MGVSPPMIAILSCCRCSCKRSAIITGDINRQEILGKVGQAETLDWSKASSLRQTMPQPEAKMSFTVLYVLNLSAIFPILWRSL
jgi:hypothetical protein